MAWNSATDLGTGVGGYSFAWDTCTPDEVKDVEETVTWVVSQVSTSGAHNFAVRAVDKWGNWGSPACTQVTIDATAPSSSVAALPAAQTHNWWLVDWSGSDAHSGLARYDVQYKNGSGGTWVNWLAGVVHTRGLFLRATPGALYYFRCRAVDRTGNVEGWPAGADAWTAAGADPSGLTEVRLPLIARQ
jgi:predicted phage tail protein